MVLHNLEIVGTGLKDIAISGERIMCVSDCDSNIQKSNELHVQFENTIAFPGLINSHDHLDFNLFPQLGNRIYNNYTEWAKDIHSHDKAKIEVISRIPKELRAMWGIYKNLLNGVTTVVNHGDKLEIKDSPISIFQDCYSLHSVQFGKRWKQKLNAPLVKKMLFVMHAGEGTDELAKQEIDELIRWNLFKRKIIAVHGVAMTEQQAKHFEALVWCPVSNYFLLNRTANIAMLKNYTQIIFGTDSTLSAEWNVWEHLRIAANADLLSSEELYQSVTFKPAIVWNLKDCGAISENKFADIVVAKRKNGADDLKSFFAINPEDILLVFHHGAIKLFDESLHNQLIYPNLTFSNFSKIYINSACKYVQGNLPELMIEIKKYYAGAKFPVQTFL